MQVLKSWCVCRHFMIRSKSLKFASLSCSWQNNQYALPCPVVAPSTPHLNYRYRRCSLQLNLPVSTFQQATFLVLPNLKSRLTARQVGFGELRKKSKSSHGSGSEETGGDQMPAALIGKFSWNEPVASVVSPWVLVSSFYTQHVCYSWLCSGVR